MIKLDNILQIHNLKLCNWYYGPRTLQMFVSYFSKSIPYRIGNQVLLRILLGTLYNNFWNSCLCIVTSPVFKNSTTMLNCWVNSLMKTSNDRRLKLHKTRFLKKQLYVITIQLIPIIHFICCKSTDISVGLQQFIFSRCIETDLVNFSRLFLFHPIVYSRNIMYDVARRSSTHAPKNKINKVVLFRIFLCDHIMWISEAIRHKYPIL